ncbi:hypothetical protein F5I97DRAFT_1994880 [Phlebopus sp. FC_14]|nr:hypothetical protein F5I97DRAFT_1994880 [Phlebopus sp. FC_14]
MRQIDEMLSQNTMAHFDSIRLHDPDNNEVLIARSPSPPNFTPLPGPWGFLTSSYIVGLFVMAILMHRIQNIVVPPRHHFHSRFSRTPRHTLFLQVMYRSIFPLDFSSSLVRFILRLPSLYFLVKSLLAWVVTLTQTANKFPEWNRLWLQSLGRWVAQQEMPTLCWSTFCSVCGALCVEALTRGLEGSGSNASPFNLFGYAFLLHIYSSPMTHGTKVEGSPSRPDAHVVFTIILPLLQLTIIHCLGIKQKWSNQRLVPSTIVSLIALVHFHGVVWFSETSYPLLNYMPCLFESTLLSVTVLAIFLNVLTQVVTEGSVTRPLFAHQAVILPKWDEDFSIALLRIGTASLEASSVAGLGNEVGTIGAPTPSSMAQTEYGTVELNRFGVASINHALEGYGRKRRTKKGFLNEIKSVKATSTEGELWLDMNWYRELARFGIGVALCIKGLWLFLWSIVSGRSRPQDQPSTEDREGIDPQVVERREEQEVYNRFVRGEQVSDDEYDEYKPARASRSNSISSSSSRSRSESAEEEDSPENGVETVGLYADLSYTVPSTSAFLLLAHMVDESSSPMTRRRFDRLISGASSQSVDGNNRDEWPESVRACRSTSGSLCHAGTEDILSDARRNCVICMIEPRQIICWPCRCLALCDDCRENLASRSSASKHSCPCCRRNVEGYSKIYIP